jgi:hypothetical protein
VFDTPVFAKNGPRNFMPINLFAICHRSFPY